MSNVFTDQEWTEHLEATFALFQRGPLVLVTDATAVRARNAAQRKAATDFYARCRGPLQGRFLGVAVVTNSALSRRAMTALQWVQDFRDGHEGLRPHLL